MLERKKKKKKQTNFLTIPFFSSCCRRRGQRQKQLLSLDRERTAGNHLWSPLGGEAPLGPPGFRQRGTVPATVPNPSLSPISAPLSPSPPSSAIRRLDVAPRDGGAAHAGGGSSASPPSPHHASRDKGRGKESDRMDMSSESSAARWYEPPRSTLEPPSGGAGVAGVVGNPTDYRGYYPHAGPTAHHPAAAAAHYAHSK